MGISILGGKSSNVLKGTFSVLSGDLHVRDDNIIIYPLALAAGEMLGDQNYLANITGPLDALEGSLNGYSSANTIESDLAILDVEGIIATSNCVKLESDLLFPDIRLYGGGAIDCELEPALVSGELTGTVPVVGSVDFTSTLVEGFMFCGAEINLESVIIAGDLHAEVPTVGHISGEAKLSILTGSFDAIVPFGADLIGDLRLLTGTLEAHTDTSAQVQGYLTTLAGNLHAQTESQGSLEGDLQILSGYVHAQHSVNGDIEGNLSVLIPTLGLVDAESYDYRILRFIRGETR